MILLIDSIAIQDLGMNNRLCEVISDEDGEKQYAFKSPDYEQFKIIDRYLGLLWQLKVDDAWAFFYVDL